MIRDYLRSPLFWREVRTARDGILIAVLATLVAANLIVWEVV